MVKQNTEKAVVKEERSSSDPKYKGVRKRKWGRWVSEIRLPNSRERIWLGSYDSAEKAARAFDAALFCLRGRMVKFNFPENPPNIAGGRSLSPPEIQEAAARFAHSEPDPTTSQSNQSEMDQSVSVSESRAESPCPSVVSDETEILTWDGPFLDMLMNTNTEGSSNHLNEYGIFPGFDDLHNDFFAPSLIPNLEYGEEINLDGILEQDSFLWNF